mmetsp:Transcript_16393/g.19671  ORF Transcript_16393/g.19671 Transcript_16393/m.19671 type:complete len:105 (+) Transcript_16393:237-551(+)|eukprot:jgi/Bigna1/64000/fgenesh1_kg.65_\
MRGGYNRIFEVEASVSMCLKFQRIMSWDSKIFDQGFKVHGYFEIIGMMNVDWDLYEWCQASTRMNNVTCISSRNDQPNMHPAHTMHASQAHDAISVSCGWNVDD